MTNLTANIGINRLLLRCTRGDESSCAKLDRLFLMLEVSRRLEDLFPVPEFKDPRIGLDPSPINDIFEDFLAEVDPDGTPARFLPKGLSKDSKAQLRAATEMRKALLEIVDDIDIHIKELRAG